MHRIRGSSTTIATAWNFAADRRSPERGQCITTIVWDSRDRLVEVKVNGTSVARYGYDTQNLRVYVNDAQGERRVLLDGVEELAELEAAAMTQVARYTHDPSRIDRLLAQHAGSTTYAVTDALGSVYGLTDASVAIQARYSFDVYGARAPSTENASTSWGYTGRRHESSGGMYYRARYYDPGTATFVSTDPKLGRQLLINGYRYADGNPVGNLDPDGQITISSIPFTIRTTYQTLEFAPPPEEHRAFLYPAIWMVTSAVYTPWCRMAFEKCGNALPGIYNKAAYIYERAHLYYVPQGGGDATGFSDTGAGVASGMPNPPGTFAIAYTLAAVKRRQRTIDESGGFASTLEIAATLLHEMAHHAGALDETGQMQVGRVPIPVVDLSNPREAAGVARRCLRR